MAAAGQVKLCTFVFERGHDKRGRALLPLAEFDRPLDGASLEGGVRIEVGGQEVMNERVRALVDLFWADLVAAAASLRSGEEYSNLPPDNGSVRYTFTPDRRSGHTKIVIDGPGEAFRRAGVETAEFVRAILAGATEFCQALRRIQLEVQFAQELNQQVQTLLREMALNGEVRAEGPS